MTKINPEHLSAGMDGELSREELRFLLRRLDHDQALRGQWSRFHLAGDGLRRELPALASGGFATRVMASIEQERSGSARRRSGWLRVSAGGAIAASVAVVALMATRPVGDGGAGGITRNQAAATLAEAPAAQPSATPMIPAAAPAWLNASNPFSLSQQASATLGGPILGPAALQQQDGLSPYQRSLSPYQVKGYRALQNNDGSYLLLVDPTRQAARRPVREAASAQ